MELQICLRILVMDAQNLCDQIIDLRRRAAVLTRNRLMRQAATALCTADILDKRLRARLAEERSERG
jgi:hypothetical protein